jgi:hypothetical protein
MLSNKYYYDVKSRENLIGRTNSTLGEILNVHRILIEEFK